jgi:hypothetical protein
VSKETRNPVVRIEVKIQVGEHLMAATDDPLFLGIRGPDGREFRLRLQKGKFLRKGKLDHFVLGAPDDDDANVEQAELNDPTSPPLSADEIPSVYLRKGFEPIPNVRAMGEMDDRLLIESAEVDVVGRDGTVRFARSGPIWVGLSAGLSFEIPRVGTGS